VLVCGCFSEDGEVLGDGDVRFPGNHLGDRGNFLIVVCLLFEFLKIAEVCRLMGGIGSRRSWTRRLLSFRDDRCSSQNCSSRW
jgi:hypothetical protein